jgi:hypothetical protein
MRLDDGKPAAFSASQPGRMASALITHKGDGSALAKGAKFRQALARREPIWGMSASTFIASAAPRARRNRPSSQGAFYALYSLPVQRAGLLIVSINRVDSRMTELFGHPIGSDWRQSKEDTMRHIFILPIAAALVFEPLAFNSDRAEAMISNPGLERFADALSPIEKAGCWRYGWHGWGWYPCGWRGYGYYGGGGWGWHRGWHGGGWHGGGWHRGGWHGGGWHRR